MNQKIGDSRVAEESACSICMATFNGARFVTDQVESVLRDLHMHDELVIVDDASTDATVEKLRAIRDPRVRVFVSERNLGLLRTFESAVGRANGDVLFFCDQDDIWYVGKRDKMVRAVLEDGVLAAVCNCHLIDESGAIIHESYFEHRGSGSGFFKNLYKNSYLGCAMCFRRELLPAILPFPTFLIGHDEWVGLMANMFCDVSFLPEPLFAYRRHDKNVSSLRWGGVRYAVKKRILNVIALVSRVARAHRVCAGVKRGVCEWSE